MPTAKDMIKGSYDMATMIVDLYTKDLGDEDLKAIPIEGMNAIGWQLGHLICSERGIVESLRPGSSPPLPEGFAEAHGKEKGHADGVHGLRTADEYRDLCAKQRAATRKVLDELTDADLDKPTEGNMASFAPTGAAMISLPAHHMLMHLGQFVAVRRHLGKPIAM